MRAGLVSNSVHVPDTWGGWRVHPEQATKVQAPGATPRREQIEQMIDQAIAQSQTHISPAINALLRRRRKYFLQRWQSDQMRNKQSGRIARVSFLLRELLSEPSVPLEYLGRRLRGVYGWELPPIEVVEEWLTLLGYSPIIEVNRSKS
jgi:hypothetical protein